MMTLLLLHVDEAWTKTFVASSGVAVAWSLIDHGDAKSGADKKLRLDNIR